MTVLVDPATGESLGIDVRNIGAGLPAAFSVPYAITDIQPNQDYVVTAEVGDEGQTWRNVAGVPVITNGNPKSGVQIVVTPVAVAPSPSPSANPESGAQRRTGSGSGTVGRQQPARDHHPDRGHRGARGVPHRPRPQLDRRVPATDDRRRGGDR